MLFCEVFPNEKKVEQKRIPAFYGSVEKRLRDACVWMSENEPGRCLTLEEIANIMGVTRERVRQLESQALRKLRHPSRVKFLNN